MKKFLFFLLFFIFGFSFSIKAQENSEGYENIASISGVAIDGKSGQILYAKNPNVKIPPASTVKLLTAMVVLDRLSLKEKVVISKKAEDTPSISPHLREGEIYTVEDLLFLMLMKSSNQASVALAKAVAGSEEIFADLMNNKAKMLGFKNSHFVTASGLPGGNQYTTAYELALLLYEALKYPLIKEILNTPVKVISSFQGRTFVIKNTNKLLFEDELKEVVLGGKTGYTNLSKHCLVNVANVDGHLIITSLLGAPNRGSLWEDTKKLLNFSKLVLTGKTSPIVINTVVNLSIPANFKRDIYKNKHVMKKSKILANKKQNKSYLSKSKQIKKKIYTKNNLKNEVITKTKSKNKLVKRSKKLQTASITSRRNS